MVKLFLKSGLLVMTVSSLFFAFGDVLAKLMSPAIGVIQIAFFRFLLGGLILGPVLVSTRTPLRGKSSPILLLRGLVGTLAFFSLLKSIAMIPLSHAMVLFYTFPLFATFFSIPLLNERLRTMEIVMILMGVAGIYILINPSSHSFALGHILGLMAGCSAGLVMVLTRKLGKTNGPLIIYFYFCIVGGVLTLPFFVMQYATLDCTQLLLLFAFAATFSIAQILMNQGFRICKASEGSVILMSEVVFTGIAGVTIFDDLLSLGFLAGSLLIVGSGVALNLANHKR